MAMSGRPDCNRNYRGNPGLLIQYTAPKGGETSNIQIDVGKTYRESMLRWYPRFGVPWLDAVVITHDHADACMGLDELRTVQRMPDSIDQTKMAASRGDFAAMPVFVGVRHMPRIASCFPYLMPKVEENAEVKRFVAKLDWIKIADFESFTCPGGLEITTVPLEHGRNYICQGFVFGTGERVAYLSDVSSVPAETFSYLTQKPISLLVLDCLFETTHAVHFGLNDAAEFVRRLRPKRTLLVGMSDKFEHHATNERLRKMFDMDGLDVQLAHDGQYIDLAL
jgi:phosphoribosyl 1,2-cyclic phosphodiesterase